MTLSILNFELFLARAKIKIDYSVKSSLSPSNSSSLPFHTAKTVDPFIKNSRPSGKIGPTVFLPRVGPIFFRRCDRRISQATPQISLGSTINCRRLPCKIVHAKCAYFKISSYLRIAHQCRKPWGVMVVGRHIHKRRNCTLWFWRIGISQILTVCQEQSNKGRLMGCLYTAYLLPVGAR